MAAPHGMPTYCGYTVVFGLMDALQDAEAYEPNFAELAVQANNRLMYPVVPTQMAEDEVKGTYEEVVRDL
eukprot:7965051-Pyramimonas_sp.AAC.1